MSTKYIWIKKSIFCCCLKWTLVLKVEIRKLNCLRIFFSQRAYLLPSYFTFINHDCRYKYWMNTCFLLPKCPAFWRNFISIVILLCCVFFLSFLLCWWIVGRSFRSCWNQFGLIFVWRRQRRDFNLNCFPILESK